MGQKFVDPNPGSSVEEKPFRTSTLVMAGPKILYGDGETGQKFVMPNPGLNNEAVVRHNIYSLQDIYIYYFLSLALSQPQLAESWSQDKTWRRCCQQFHKSNCWQELWSSMIPLSQNIHYLKHHLCSPTEHPAWRLLSQGPFMSWMLSSRNMLIQTRSRKIRYVWIKLL